MAWYFSLIFSRVFFLYLGSEMLWRYVQEWVFLVHSPQLSMGQVWLLVCYFSSGNFFSILLYYFCPNCCVLFFTNNIISSVLANGGDAIECHYMSYSSKSGKDYLGWWQKIRDAYKSLNLQYSRTGGYDTHGKSIKNKFGWFNNNYSNNYNSGA